MDHINRFVLRLRVLIVSVLLCVALPILIAMLGIPFGVFRFSVKFVAKYTNSKLEEIMSPVSSVLSNDYFSGMPPRSSIVVSLVWRGQITIDQIRKRIQNFWITPVDPKSSKPFYPELQLYPTRWLGFTFWKREKDFSVRKHVTQLKTNKVITVDELTELMEKFINSKFSIMQSPWSLYLLNNYKNQEDPLNPHSVLILRYHHCLADGMSMLKAFVSAFGDDCNIILPKSHSRNPKSLLEIVSAPFVSVYHLAEIFVNLFSGSPALKVPDATKQWHQVVTASQAISIQSVKNIKNGFEVCFGSVVVSCVSSAISKFLKSKNYEFNHDTMNCAAVLPILEKNPLIKKLRNYATSGIIQLPVGNQIESVQRLNYCHTVIKSSRTSVPLMAYYLIVFKGYLPYWINNRLENSTIPVGFTNVAGVPDTVVMDNATLVQAFAVAGALAGDAGITVTVFSHEQQLRIFMAAEQSIMSKDEAQLFLKNVEEELTLLKTELLHRDE